MHVAKSHTSNSWRDRVQALTARRTLSGRFQQSLVLVAGAVICAMSARAANAQNTPTGVIRGVVVRMPSGTPVAGARVYLSAQHVETDSAGQFGISGVVPGVVELRAEAPGMIARTVSVNVAAIDTTRVFIRLANHAVELQQFVVTAQENRSSSQGSSASIISRDAIEHVQASSLADILQLVPGQPAVNPSLAGPRQSLLRQAPTATSRDPGAGTEAERSNALGTSVVVDGVPLSNNANLQTTLTILNSGPNALPQFASTAGRGLDLRQIPADNIESVEVVRGIPSVRHGDLTAGAILVTSRAGAQRPELRIRANPLTLEASTVAGWGRSRNRGLSIDAGIVRSLDDPRSTVDAFTRATTQVAWSAQPSPGVSTTVRVRGYSVLDESKQDPDDARYQRAVSSRDRGFRADLRMQLAANRNRGWRADFTASASMAEQVGKYQELVTRDIFPLTDVRRDTLAPGVFGRSEYLGSLTVDGRPLNLFARAELPGAFSRGVWRHEPLIGVEYRRDSNGGHGRLFDAIRPPRQNYGVGDRPDDFSSVRSQTIVSPYAEYRLRGLTLNRPVDVSIGVRIDAVDLTGRSSSTVVAPRVNARWQPFASLGVYGGYGVTSKAPTLSQRYPLPRYFDLVSFNHYPTNPSERLVLFTTRVINPRTEGLGSVRTQKLEGALEWKRAGLNGTLTLFSERTQNAFGTTRIPIGIQVPKFRALSFPAGQPPVIDPNPVGIDPFVGLYDAPRNSRGYRTRGIELTADLAEVRVLRTAFSIGGAWFNTRAFDNDVDIPVEQFLGGTTQPARVGVYTSGNGSEAQRILTTLRATHRLPEVGLAATLILQTTWAEDDRPIGRLDSLPIGFVDLSGTITALTPQQALQPEFSSLRRGVLAENARWERRPPLHLVNVRITKAMPARTQLALFANNALANLPLYQRRRQAGFERRNQPAFFGIEFLAALNFSPFS